ncbi:hypothetical protein LCM17_18340 [Cereibacter sphaeroides]|nr:hypothetical protein [Cereibacter sphaeroides]
MRLVLHIGAHGTDGGQIAGWIDRNRGALEADGIVAPAPRLFLGRLSEVLDQQRDADPLAREEALLRGLGASGQRRHMCVSAPGLLGSVSDVLSEEGFYRRGVVPRLQGLSALFPRTRLRLLLSVRAARGLIPALLPDEPGAADAILPLIPDDTLPWSRLVGSLRRHLPRAELVVWRHEDLPAVWPQVLSEILGSNAALPPQGLLDFAQAGLGHEARLRMRRYLAEASAPPANAGQLRRIAEAFAHRYGTAATPEPLIRLPGWIRSRLEDLDAGYDTEWADLAAQHGVRVLLTPGAESTNPS